MEKMNLEQMENIRGGFEPANSFQWSETGECYLALVSILELGYDPGNVVGGFWDSCNS